MTERRLSETNKISNVASDTLFDISVSNVSAPSGYTSYAVTASNVAYSSVFSDVYITQANASSTYVPYTGASGTVNLGSNILTTTGEITGELAKVQNSAPTVQIGNLWMDTTDPSSDIIGSSSFYIDCSGGTSDTYGALAGAINGSNTVFTVSQSAYVTGTLTVYLNGQLQTQGSSEDWVETSPVAGTFTFLTAPLTGSTIVAKYQKILTTVGNADTIDGFHASSSPSSGKILPLNSNAAIDVKSTYIENTTSNEDLLIKINDGGVTRTAIQVNGTEGSITMPRQSFVYAIRTTNQAISTGTITTVIFDTEVADILGEYDNSTGIFTAKNDGIYSVNTQILWEAADAGYSYNVMIYSNGVNVMDNYIDRWNGYAYCMPASASVKITAGQTIKIQVVHYRGSNENVYGAATPFSALTITKVS